MHEHVGEISCDCEPNGRVQGPSEFLVESVTREKIEIESDEGALDEPDDRGV